LSSAQEDLTYTNPQISPVRRIAFEGVVFEQNSMSITFRDQSAYPNPLAYNVAFYFFARFGKMCTRRELLSEVWGCEAKLQTRRVDIQVSRVRQLLQDIGCPYNIVATRNEGYQLVARTRDTSFD